MVKTSRHLIIPDTQAKPGSPNDHMKWIGQAIAEYQPNVVVHLGDHWDMPSLSRWAGAGSIEKEGARVSKDISAGNESLERLERGMQGFKPKRKVLLRGNHEQRLADYVSANPVIQGVLDYGLFVDRDLGWEVVDYYGDAPGQISIDGCLYAHFFKGPNSKHAIGGTIGNRLSKIGTTFIQGHQQGLLRGNVQYATGVERFGIVAGSAYLHDEGYKGHANTHFRGIIVLNEVKNGTFCEMPLSLDYLCKKYEGMSLARYLQRRYRNAKERFSLARS